LQDPADRDQGTRSAQGPIPDLKITGGRNSPLHPLDRCLVSAEPGCHSPDRQPTTGISHDTQDR